MNEYIPHISTRQARWLRFGGVIVGLALVLWAAKRLSGVFNPILAGLAFAYILNPLVTWLEMKRIPRLASICCIYAVGSVGLVVAVLLLADTAVQQADRLTVWVQSMIVKGSEWIKTRSPNMLAAATQPAQWLRESSGGGMAMAGSVAGWVKAAFSNTTYWATTLVLLPMYSFFFLWRFNDMVRVIRDHIPAAFRDVVVRIVSTIDRSMASFFRGRLVVCSIVGVLTAIGWLIVGVPYSIPLGLLMGVLNMVPFLSIIGLPLALLVSYVGAVDANEAWFWPVVLTLGVFLAVQAVESFLLSPYVMIQAAGLHPITTVIVLLVGAELAGVFGMLLSIPLASTVKSLAGEFIMPEIRRLAGQSSPAELVHSAPPTQESP